MAVEESNGASGGNLDERPRRQPNRGMFVLPSLFTAANIGAGFYAITQSVQGSAGEPIYFDHAALAIGIAVLCDGMDGLVARVTHTASDFGRELDSLADVITFGVAPSLLAYIWGFRMLPATENPALRENVVHAGIFVCFMFLICGACRLARFNISIDPQPRNPGKPGRKYFVGMPIPAGAGVIAALIHFCHGATIGNPLLSLAWLALLLVTSYLMVSNWRFWSAKQVTNGDRHPSRGFILIAAILAAIWWKSDWMLMILAYTYLLYGILTRLAYSWRVARARRRSSGSEPMHP
jgi:CDP-diacylglycerol--serine O-phosphatidyltransferase